MVGVAWFVAVSVLGILIWRWHVSDKRADQEFKLRQSKHEGR